MQLDAPSISTPAAADKPGISERSQAVLIAFAVVGVCLAVFWPVLTADFLRYDDNVHVFQDPYLNPVTPSHLLHFWRHPYEGLYIPFSYTVFGLLALLARRASPVLHSVGGISCLDPHVFHAANLALHLVNVLLVFALLRRFCRNNWAAGAGALVFGIHPLQVESVAWISELRGLLSGCFSLAAVNLYVTYSSSSKAGPTRRLPDWRRIEFVLATAAYVLALLAKPSAVVAPLLCLCIDRWLLGRPLRGCVLAMLPWLGLSALFLLLTAAAQPVMPWSATALWLRPVVASDALVFYAGRILWPAHLGIDYGRTPRVVLGHGYAYAEAVLVAAIAVLAWRGGARFPKFTAALLLFAAPLLPVLGLVSFGFQTYSTVADRYAYLALLGPALGAAFLVEHAIEVGRRRVRLAAVCVSVCVLSLFALRSSLQTQYWQNDYSLYTHGLDVNHDSRVSELGLGMALYDQGDFAGAEMCLKRAVALDKNYDQAWYNLGCVEQQRGELSAALDAYGKALYLNSHYVEAECNIGGILEHEGNLPGAVSAFRQATKISPDMALAHEQLGLALFLEHDRAGAVAESETALRLDPNSPIARRIVSAILRKYRSF